MEDFEVKHGEYVRAPDSIHLRLQSAETCFQQCSDLDQETERIRASGRVLQLQETMAKRGEKRERRSMVLEPDAEGIDFGAEEIYVAVPPDLRRRSRPRCSGRVLTSLIPQKSD